MRQTSQYKLIKADKQFIININRLFPDCVGLRVKTQRLNRIFEEIIYEKR